MQRRHFLATGLAGLGASARAATASSNDIVLGQSAVLSGPLGQQILAFNQGAQLAFDHQNVSGGLNGRKLRLVSLDDELKPERAVANYKTLLQEHGVTGFFGCVGSGTTAAASAVLAQSGLPMFGGYAVSDSAREKTKGLAYYVRAGYGREAESLLTLLSTIGIKRVAVAHLANPGGQEVLELARKAAADKGLSLTGAAAIPNDGKDLPQLANGLLPGEPQAVLMFLGAPLAAGLMEAVWAAGVRPSFYGMSIVAGDAVAKKLGDRARGLAIAQAVPYPWGQASPELREFHRLSEAAKLPLSYYSFEGYLNATLQLDVLRRAGPNLGAASLHAASRALNQRVAGMDVNFSSGQHTGSRFVELVQVTVDGRFQR